MSSDSSSFINQVPDNVLNTDRPPVGTVVKVSTTKKLFNGNIYTKLLVLLILLLMLFAGLCAIILLLKDKMTFVLYIIISILLVPFIIFIMLRYVFHISVFPGSSWGIRISVEHTVSLQVAKIYSKRLYSYSVIIEGLEHDNLLNLADQKLLQDHNDEIRRMLEFLLGDMDILRRKKLLGKNSLYSKMQKLNTYMQEMEVYNDDGISIKLVDLDSFLEKLNFGRMNEGIKFYFRDSEEKKMLIKCLREISQSLKDYTEALKGGGLLCHKTKFATPYQMRWSLKQKFHSRYYSLNVSNKRRGFKMMKPVALDMYLLPCLYSNDPKSEDDAIKQCPTIIICFPNGGFIEYFYFQGEWVNFYLELGINVLLWNYRGYYRSTGTPTSHNILRDSEKVGTFLRNELEVQGLIGVHGESLGGYVAGHLAKTRHLDFLFVDRSFGGFDKLIEAKYGSCMMKSFKGISGYNVHSDLNFLDTSCFKIIAQDSCDEVINCLGGLKNGITHKLISDARGIEHMTLKDVDNFTDAYKEILEVKDEIVVLFKYYNLKLEK